ncbi:MAG: hypothetical protein HZB53_21940 [Chloroflexi bacterium]|nr:hypothetical protein [Chloroflexota bacterium]
MKDTHRRMGVIACAADGNAKFWFEPLVMLVTFYNLPSKDLILIQFDGVLACHAEMVHTGGGMRGARNLYAGIPIRHAGESRHPAVLTLGPGFRRGDNLRRFIAGLGEVTEQRERKAIVQQPTTRAKHLG